MAIQSTSNPLESFNAHQSHISRQCTVTVHRSIHRLSYEVPLRHIDYDIEGSESSLPGLRGKILRDA
jgi:hypothetical protein